MKIIFIVVILVLFLSAQESVARRRHKHNTKTGGWSNVKDPESNQTYQKALAYLVQNMNSCEEIKDWTFSRVVSAQSQVVEGVQFKMQVEILKDDQKKEYPITVWVMPLNSQTNEMPVAITKCG